MATLLLVNFDLPEQTLGAIPNMKDQIKNNIQDLDISDKDLEIILGYAYQKGFHDGITEIKDILKDEGFKVLSPE